MKKISGLIIFVTILSCSKTEKKTNEFDSEINKESICLVLDNWHKNAAEGSFDNYFNSMSNSSVFIGTDASENWTVSEFKEFCKPHFADGLAWDFKAIDRNVYVGNNNNIAWFDELLNTWMGVCRGSGVLVKENSQWKIQHYVLSLTIPNDNIKDVVEINKEKDSLFLRKFQ